MNMHAQIHIFDRELIHEHVSVLHGRAAGIDGVLVLCGVRRRIPQVVVSSNFLSKGSRLVTLIGWSRRSCSMRTESTPTSISG